MTFVSTIAALGMMPFWIYTLGPYVSEDDLVIISQQSRAHVVASLVCWRGSVMAARYSCRPRKHASTLEL
jgi:hypothetical protein